MAALGDISKEVPVVPVFDALSTCDGSGPPPVSATEGQLFPSQDPA